VAVGALWQGTMVFKSLSNRGFVEAGDFRSEVSSVGYRQSGIHAEPVFITHVPRLTGDVQVPFEVTEKIEARVTMPSR